MKKLLLTIIAALAFCGSAMAQEGMNPKNWPNHYGDHDVNLEDSDWIVAFVQIDGEYVTIDDNWQDLQIGPFVSGEYRGGGDASTIQGFLWDEYYYDEPDWVIPYPVAEIEVWYTNSGEDVTFQLYDHSTGMTYTDYQVTMLSNYKTGDGDFYDIYMYDYDNAVIFNFATPATEAITLDIPANQWNLIASPVGTKSVTEIDNLRKDNNYDFYYFDQAQELEWINDKPEGFDPEAPEYAISEMVAGKGYLYAHSDAETRTLTFPGDANTDAVTVTLNKTDAVAGLEFPDWNLVGNPYNVQAYIERPFYRMEEGAFVPEPVYGAINRMEGVFVVANEDGEEMTFGTEAKAKVGNLALNLRKDNKTIDRAIVSFGDSQLLPKVQFMGETTKVYIPFEGKDYAVVNAGNMGEMPVNFKANENGTYTLLFANENVTFSYLHLIDNMTGNDVDLLANPSYTFSAVSNDYTSRFRLVFATGNSVDNDAFGFFNGAGNFCIYGIDGTATVQVMDVTGRIISSNTFSGNYEQRINAAAGVYMIRLINGNDVKVQKVVVK